MISIIVPCYNEEPAIKIFYDEIIKIEDKLADNFEIVFINDGSEDATLYEIKNLAESDQRVHFISFSRNFGKEAALLAGLEKSKGNWVVTMDVDLQDPPGILPDMFKKILETPIYDCIATCRVTRKGEPRLRSWFAKIFYKLINKLGTVQILDGARDYRLMSRRMVNAIINDREYNRFSKGIYAWVGFKTYWMEYENIERSIGESKWSFLSLFTYAIEGILAYTVKPLYLASIMGIIMCIVSFIALIFIVVRASIYGDPVSGWPSLVSIIIFLGGIILFNLGIIGLYLSKIYLETKKRQIYIIESEG